MALVECIPNISVGADKDLSAELIRTLQKQSGIGLWHYDRGEAVNRTVLTFGGEPEPTFAAAYRLYEWARAHIDLAKHRGTHPFMGSVDVCPFVPLKGITVRELNERVWTFGRRLGLELGISGYFYEHSAPSGAPRLLAELRRGGYPAIPQKIRTLEPHFGEAQHWQKGGLTVLGQRPLMLAFNINLARANREKTRLLARRMREKSHPVQEKPGLKGLRAIGWYLEDFKRWQLSCNITRLDQSALWQVFDKCQNEAADLGMEVTGSELIGLIPEKELRLVAEHQGIEEKSDQIPFAVNHLGLNEIKPFDPQKHILDRCAGVSIEY